MIMTSPDVKAHRERSHRTVRAAVMGHCEVPAGVDTELAGPRSQLAERASSTTSSPDG